MPKLTVSDQIFGMTDAKLLSIQALCYFYNLLFAHFRLYVACSTVHNEDAIAIVIFPLGILHFEAASNELLVSGINNFAILLAIDNGFALDCMQFVLHNAVRQRLHHTALRWEIDSRCLIDIAHDTGVLCGDAVVSEGILCRIRQAGTQRNRLMQIYGILDTLADHFEPSCLR